MADDLLRVERRRLKQSLRAGDELAFSPVHFSGDRVLSHTIRFERGRYRVRGADGTELGAFATFAGASKAGLEIRLQAQSPNIAPVALRVTSPHEENHDPSAGRHDGEPHESVIKVRHLDLFGIDLDSGKPPRTHVLPPRPTWQWSLHIVQG